jgi:hypothetical protein
MTPAIFACRWPDSVDEAIAWPDRYDEEAWLLAGGTT